MEWQYEFLGADKPYYYIPDVALVLVVGEVFMARAWLRPKLQRSFTDLEEAKTYALAIASLEGLI